MLAIEIHGRSHDNKLLYDDQKETSGKLDYNVNKMSKNLVVLIHGWGNNGSSAFFPELKKYLKSKGYLVESPDLPESPNQKYGQSFNDIRKILDQTKITSISLLGHSSGGYLAAKIAEHYKIDQLVLIAPTCPSSEFSNTRITEIQNWLDGEALHNYMDFHSSPIDFTKLVKNTNKISLLFGLKDPYIDEANRKYYISRLNGKAEIMIFDHYGHMGEDEVVNELPELRNIF
jgi:pimeloyl-ACP methyl ester carboxylesterase